jgi:hypothetical protein
LVRSSTSNQKPPRLNFGSFQPLVGRGLSRTFFSVRRCSGARQTPAHARWAINWTAHLGHSAACAVVLGAAGVAAPYVTSAISEFCDGVQFPAESGPAASGRKPPGFDVGRPRPLKEKSRSSAPEGVFSSRIQHSTFEPELKLYDLILGAICTCGKIVSSFPRIRDFIALRLGGYFPARSGPAH